MIFAYALPKSCKIFSTVTSFPIPSLLCGLTILSTIGIKHFFEQQIFFNHRIQKQMERVTNIGRQYSFGKLSQKEESSSSNLLFNNNKRKNNNNNNNNNCEYPKILSTNQEISQILLRFICVSLSIILYFLGNSFSIYISSILRSSSSSSYSSSSSSFLTLSNFSKILQFLCQICVITLSFTFLCLNTHPKPANIIILLILTCPFGLMFGYITKNQFNLDILQAIGLAFSCGILIHIVMIHVLSYAQYTTKNDICFMNRFFLVIGFTLSILLFI